MKFSYEQFKDPTVQYRGLPFWSWNCKLNKDIIDEQLEIFREMGFGGVVIHPREGLDTEYLGEEFMDIVKYTAECCRKKGLICWLYDDDRFPSGAADGLVTKNPRFRGRQLVLTETRLDDCCGSENEFNERIDKGEIPKGYYLAAYSLRFSENGLEEYHMLGSENEIKESNANGETVRYAYLMLHHEDDWFQGKTYVDTMNPAAVEEFINITHERYKKSLGGDFGKTVKAIFTDEPRMGRQTPLDFTRSHEDVCVPYTEYFAKWFKERNGIDALSVVPEYVWNRADGDVRGRYLYRDGVCECFAEVFMDRICKWCGENGIIMTGHILGEETLLSQTTMVGAAMRAYKNMDIPGMDLLIDGRELANCKQVTSIAAQYGREGAMSEEYGATQWDCTFKTYKLQGDWQAALGITHRVPHLSHMTIEGEGKRDWPASIFYQSPWYKEFSYIENHFARLNSVLTRGRRITRTAVVHPVESYWVMYGTDRETADARSELDAEFDALSKWLLYGLVDFDYLCESLLSEQCDGYDGEARLAVGRCRYDTVIVPGLYTIRKTTLDILERFAKAGGTVVFAGRVPRLVDGIKSDRALKLAESCKRIKLAKQAVLSAVEAVRDIRVTDASGRMSQNLFYQLREDEDCRWLFLCHVNHDGNEKEEYKLEINGSCKLTLYDTMTGERYIMPSRINSGVTEADIECFGQDSLLIRLEENQPELPVYTGEENHHEVQRLSDVISFKREEPNVLLLDHVSGRLDGVKEYPREEVLRLDNTMRADMGFFERTGRNLQPWATEEGKAHKIELFYEFYSEINVKAQLALEHPERCRIIFNGNCIDNTPCGRYIDKSIKRIDLPEIKAGVNRITVEMAYNQKTQPENMYILGEFGVKVKGGNAVITEDIKKLSLGSIKNNGMPFYTGNLEYSFEADIAEDGVYYIRIDEFSAPLLGAAVDGEDKGLIAYAPHRICLGGLSRGTHRITVRMYGNRHNIMGTLHNADENYTWYGNGAYRTKGSQWTDDYVLRDFGIMSEIILEK